MTNAQATIQWLITNKGYSIDEFYTIGDVSEAISYLDTTELQQLEKYVSENA